MLNIVVTGATGFLGRQFTRNAVDARATVTALTRRPDEDLTARGVRVLPSDMGNWAKLDVAPADALVHLAAATSGSREEMLAVAREGVRNAVSLCKCQDIPQLIHISSLSVYGPRSHRDPNDLAAALDRGAAFRGGYADSKVEAERALHAAVAAGETEGLAVDIVRPGLVFGWDMGSPLGGTAVELPLGFTIGLGRPSGGVPFVHIDDVSDALLGMLHRPAEPGIRVHDLLSGRPVAKEVFLESFEKLTGRGGQPLWIPRNVAVGLAAVAEGAFGAVGRPRSLRYAVQRLWDFDPTDLPWEDLWGGVAVQPRHDVESSIRVALSTGVPKPTPDADLQARVRGLLQVADTKASMKPLPPLVLVGAGRVVHDLHVPALSDLGAHVIAVVDPSASARQDLLETFTHTRVADSLDDLDGDALPGATAVISTPGFTHADLAVDAMRRGMDVLLEKPAATSESDLERVRAAAEEYGSIVTVIHNYRLRPNTLALWHFLAEHDVGPLTAARVTFHTGKLAHEQAPYMRQGDRYRALPMELGVHFVDICCTIGGAVTQFEHVRVDGDPEGAGTTRIEAQGRLERGAWIALDLNATGTARRTSISLAFERAALELVFFPEGFRVHPAGRNPVDDAAFAARQFAHALRQQVVRRVGRSNDRGLPHRAIYQEHARRVIDRDLESSFSLAGVAPATRSLSQLSELAFNPV